ncbi:MAG: hypothetical protein R3A44_02460 [Caldilineaceae bacterium]
MSAGINYQPARPDPNYYPLAGQQRLWAFCVAGSESALYTIADAASAL